MSRSYKKNPVYKINRAKMKKIANDRVRNSKNIPNGKAYKKFFPSWDIADWVIYDPWPSRKAWLIQENRYTEDSYRHWLKLFYRK